MGCWRARGSRRRRWLRWRRGRRGGQRGSGAAGSGAARQRRASRPRPGLVPAVVADGVAQDQPRMDLGPRPLPAGPGEAGFDDQVGGALHVAAAHGPAGGRTGGGLQPGHALVPRRQHRPHRGGRLGQRRPPLGPRGQQRLGAVGLAALQARRPPGRIRGATVWSGRPPRRARRQGHRPGGAPPAGRDWSTKPWLYSAPPALPAATWPPPPARRHLPAATWPAVSPPRGWGRSLSTASGT